MNRNRNLLTTTCIAAMLAMPMAVQAGDSKTDMNAGNQHEVSDAGSAAGEAPTGERSELQKAWDEFARFTAEQKDAAVQAGDDMLNAMDERIAGWREAAREDGVSPEEEEDRVAEMRSVRRDISSQLDEARVTHDEDWSAEVWRDFKQAVGEAVDTFESQFDDDTAYESGEKPYQEGAAGGN
ncbi:hypothetical protein CVT23_11290 [Minwuia thermotolerans]|uniref:Uncharacterized protein n=2 Tax=Minwuia thermotolerans TaxID=2056226 RepID=A0A2M9G1P4_9PROT|nr:hypothetical protein CVT23_11290 [Minwuia thermotolerans]